MYSDKRHLSIPPFPSPPNSRVSNPRHCGVGSGAAGLVSSAGGKGAGQFTGGGPQAVIWYYDRLGRHA